LFVRKVADWVTRSEEHEKDLGKPLRLGETDATLLPSVEEIGTLTVS